MSLTSMLINRQVPTFPPGLPTFTNRPDANRRPIIVAGYGLKTISAQLMEGRNRIATESIARSLVAILKAINEGAKTKPAIAAKSGISKSSVFNHCKSMIKDGILMFDKSTMPWTVEVTK